MSPYAFSGLKRIKLDFINKISVAIDKVIKKKRKQFYLQENSWQASDSISNFSSHWGTQNSKRKTLSWLNI